MGERRRHAGVTDVLVLTPVGQLPLTRPLLDAGVPPETAAALDPVLRAVIEAGYDRPAPGEPYPSEPVRFEPLPTSATELLALADRSAELLAGVVQPNQPATPPIASSTALTAATPTNQPAAGEPVGTRSTTTPQDTKPALAENDPQPARVNETHQPSVTQRSSPTATGPNKTEPSPRGTNSGSDPGDVVRAVVGNRDESSTTNGTTQRDASNAASGTTRSGSPSGASSTSGGSK